METCNFTHLTGVDIDSSICRNMACHSICHVCCTFPRNFHGHNCRWVLCCSNYCTILPCGTTRLYSNGNCAPFLDHSNLKERVLYRDYKDNRDNDYHHSITSQVLSLLWRRVFISINGRRIKEKIFVINFESPQIHHWYQQRRLKCQNICFLVGRLMVRISRKSLASLLRWIDLNRVQIQHLQNRIGKIKSRTYRSKQIVWSHESCILNVSEVCNYLLLPGHHHKIRISFLLLAMMTFGWNAYNTDRYIGPSHRYNFQRMFLLRLVQCWFYRCMGVARYNRWLATCLELE